MTRIATVLISTFDSRGVSTLRNRRQRFPDHASGHHPEICDAGNLAEDRLTEFCSETVILRQGTSQLNQMVMDRLTPLLIWTPVEYHDYFEIVNNPINWFRTITVPFQGGFELPERF